jgi:hypothetical protein
MTQAGLQTPVDLVAFLKTDPMAPASRPRQISGMG